jgi:RimJ/RimL family protein N-acetyltransferase
MSEARQVSNMTALPRELRTARLLLRRWRPEDLEPFAAINADARVMEYFQRTENREETAGAIGRIEEGFEKNGFGWWAVEIPGVTPFAGFVGLSIPPLISGTGATRRRRREPPWRLGSSNSD